MDRDENDDVEIPPYFLCPITLQIMKDPVTTITGITYDRHSILKWISKSTNNNINNSLFPPLCPVTNQPLSSSDDDVVMIIPNHTLRRLIHQWCSRDNGYDYVSVLNESRVMKLIQVLENVDVETKVFVSSLTRVEELLLDEVNRSSVLLIMEKCECDVPKLLLELLLRCLMKCLTECVKKCLVVLTEVWSSACSYHPTHDFKTFLDLNGVDLVHHLSSYATSARRGPDHLSDQHALSALKQLIELLSFNQKQLINKNFFSNMVKFIKLRYQHSTATIQVLQILIHLSSNAGNRINIMEAGTIHTLIELQLHNTPTHKRTTDLIFNLLSLLCHYVEGRERFLSHSCSLPLMAECLLKVSQVVDEHILEIILLISKFSRRKELVVAEMLEIGIVSKLCMAIQADCADYMKAKARKVLRMHWSSWNGSPCISLYLLAAHYR